MQFTVVSKRSVPVLESFDSEETYLSWDKHDRSSHIAHRGWFVLTEYTINTLTRLLGSDTTVEVFSGTGLLNHHLRLQRPTGTITKAYDNRSYGRCSSGVWKAYSNPYSGSKKNCFMLPIRKFDSVIMAWPRYDRNDAYRIIRKMKPGQKLYYQGESWGGCCANDRFFEYLETHFTILAIPTRTLNAKTVQFIGIRDEWSVYIKKEIPNVK